MNLPEEVAEQFEGMLLADGFESALIGFGTRFTHPVAVYDYDRCVRVLVERDAMTEEEAVDYLEFNTTGAYVGESTPVFVRWRR